MFALNPALVENISLGSFRQFADGIAGEANVAPLVQKLCAHGTVEIDGRSVPVQNLPLQAAAVVFKGNRGHLPEQRLADSFASNSDST